MNAGTPTQTSISGLSWEPLGGDREIKSELRSPLFDILTQINIAAENGLDLIAISMAVALPDICASLISDNGRTTPDRYKQWCSDNLKGGFYYVTPDDLYSMRCGVLHNGRFGDLKHNVDRIVFAPKGGSIFVGCIDENIHGEKAYIYSTVEFCRNVNRAVVAWYAANQDHPNVRANMVRLMQYRPDGYGGLQGTTVVA
jgi:hypothetical protein